TVAGAQNDAKVSKDEVMADTERANQINLIMAIIVVVSLIASVVFSFLGVARPMTRLNGAVGKLAGRTLDAETPGAGRGAEGGDQWAGGGVLHRGDGLVHHRDRPSGPGIGADGQ